MQKILLNPLFSMQLCGVLFLVLFYVYSVKDVELEISTRMVE